jgi:predicted acyl esterase
LVNYNKEFDNIYTYILEEFKIMEICFFRKSVIMTIIFLIILSNVLTIGFGKLLENNEIIPEPIYTKETIFVEMRDSIRLATDLYLPDGGSPPHGSILIRTPYNKNNSNFGGWADAGWPTLVQDMRGRFQSEGIDTVFRNAHTDGPDTLSWMANQSWSNGKIATFGGSALGINQYFNAGANPPNLTCQFIGVATPNLYKHAMYQGGEFRKRIVEGWLEGQGSSFVLPELWEHENYTMDYWTNVSLDDNWQDVNVPAIHHGGWYDCFAQGTIDGFIGYHYLGGPGAKGQSKLIMGPWTHGGSVTTTQGELDYPENCKDNFSFDMFVEMLDQYILNTSNEYQNRPNVSYYVMGDVTDKNFPGNEWRYSDYWPIEHHKSKWYLQENGLLSRHLPEEFEPYTYFYNPNNPVPTIGGQNLILPRGPYDQISVESRDDVLIFTSNTLEEPYEATGPIVARLFVSSNCYDTDFTVKLTDVYPDGRSMLITDGILRMRNRNGCDHWEFMEPGVIYEVEIDLWSSSYIWNIGHKIRVAVSSSNYPRFLNNPNTKDGIYQNTDYKIAENKVYCDSNHPSCIILPHIEENYPPEMPIINGSTRGKPEIEYEYSFVSIDPNGDDIAYLLDWGDGIEEVMGNFPSGKTVYKNHTWGEKGTYTVRAKAVDNLGAESDWSEFEVTIPRNRSIKNSWINWFLERFHLLKEFMQFFTM